MAKFLTIRHSFCELMTKKDAISSNPDCSISKKAKSLSENSNVIIVSDGNKYEIITPSEFIRLIPIAENTNSLTTIIDSLDEASEEEREKYLTHVLTHSKKYYSIETICDLISKIIINKSGVNCSCEKCNQAKDVLEICYDLPKEDINTSIKKFMSIHTISSNLSKLCTIINKNNGSYNHKTNDDKDDKQIDNIVDKFIKFLFGK